MNTQSSGIRRGLLAGGNWIIDQVKIIDVYPAPEKLGNILGQFQGTGGGPYNVLMDLAHSGVSFPLFGAGLVGKDALGDQILAGCRKQKIDAHWLAQTNKAPTSFTDVMTERAIPKRVCAAVVEESPPAGGALGHHVRKGGGRMNSSARRPRVCFPRPRRRE
jgi:hypothetical protein